MVSTKLLQGLKSAFGFGHTTRPGRRSSRGTPTARRMRLEPLEDRTLLSATIFIDDATAIEGDQGGRFVDTFVPGGSGGLYGTVGLTFRADGDLFVASQHTDSVLRYDGLSGAFVEEFVASNSGGLIAPKNIAFGPDGDLYVASRDTDEVLRYDGATGAPLGAFVTAGDGGLDGPFGLVFGPGGHLYVSSLNTDEVYHYDDTGTFAGVFVTAGNGGLDKPKGLLFGPSATGDGADDLYVASALTDQVLRYNGVSGAFIDAFVTAGSGGLGTPNWMAFGPDGNLYVSSSTFEVLRYDGTSGTFLDAFVPALSGGLYYPRGLAFDTDGHLYVSNGNDGPDEVLRYAPVSAAVFTVSLSSPSEVPITVDFSTADGTATEGTDYLPNSGTLTFESGITERLITVQTLGDADPEQSESFFVNLTNASPGTSIGDSPGLGTIRDDVVVAAFASTDVPKKLVDAVQEHGVTTSTLFVPNSGNVVDVDVHFDITHERNWDLSVFLIAPDGTEVSLFEIWDHVGEIADEGFSGTILDDEASLPLTAGSAPFTGRYRPPTALSEVHSPDLNTENLSGTWTLRVEDCFHRYRGTLNSWSITVSYLPVETPNSPPTADAGGPYAGLPGSDIPLDASGSTDSDGTIVEYLWDLNNDGQYDDASGATATFNSATAGQYTVGVQVTDDDGASSTDTATVTVQEQSAELVYTSNDGPINIGDLKTVSSSINISDTGATIESLILQINLTHASPSDLTARLVSPTGIGLNIGGPILSGDHEYAIPDASDLGLDGTWTLQVTDGVKNRKRGSLIQWTMTVTPQAAATSSQTATAADLALAAWGDPDSSDDDETDPLTESLVDDLALMLV